MKLRQLSALAGLLALGSGTAMAGSDSLNHFNTKYLPVLVQVDSHGKVTDASAAMELAPKLKRLLYQNLGEMITSPATNKHGRAIASQFIINLELQATPLDDGNFDTKFAYISTAPVPNGSWYWVHTDGVQLSLARRGAGESSTVNHQISDPVYRPEYQPAQQTQPMPSMQTPSAPAPAPAANVDSSR